MISGYWLVINCRFKFYFFSPAFTSGNIFVFTKNIIYPHYLFVNKKTKKILELQIICSLLQTKTHTLTQFKPNRTPTVKIDKSVYSRYFKPSQPTKEIQNIVEKALELYFEQR